MLLQAFDMRALIILVDGVDEAAGMRDIVEAFVHYELVTSGNRLVVTSRPEGVCVKLVTRPGENLPGVFVEDRNRNVLHTTMLGNEHESHFDARCHECVLP